MPEAGRFARAQHATTAEEPRTGGMQPLRVGKHRPHAAHVEARAQGVVEVAVGGGHALEQLPRPLARRLAIPSGRMAVTWISAAKARCETFSLDEGGVVDAVAVALPARLRPAHEAEDGDDTQTCQDRLPELARLHPAVALHGAEHGHRKEGRRHAAVRVLALLADGCGRLLLEWERRLEGFAAYPCAHPGPRDCMRNWATTRSPSPGAEKRAEEAMSGSEPGSRRSSSR